MIERTPRPAASLCREANAQPKARTFLRLSTFLPALLVALIAISGAPTMAQAATIVVNTSNTVITNDSECGLLEAIIAANTNAANNGCPAGEAAPTVDLIELSNVTYSLQGPVDFS